MVINTRSKKDKERATDSEEYLEIMMEGGILR
jgi:hypothetical protein